MRGGPRETAFRFTPYAEAVHARLGDRVRTWTTLNEPWVAAFLGHGSGVHAPGGTDPADAFRSAHHLLLAHGLGARALREAGARELALTLNLSPALGDPAAAERVDLLLNRQSLDPALRGEMPEPLLRIVERHAGLGHLRDGDLELIHQPIDLLGINYYCPQYVAGAPGAPADPAWPGGEDLVFVHPGGPSTAMGWPIEPAGLTGLLTRLSRDYPDVALIITENGAAFDDPAPSGGRVADPDRVAYLDAHVRAAHAALAEGADLRGYLVWSVLDNFEWAEGYHKRFGIVHVDYPTQRRTPKDSALWFRDQIAAQPGAVPALSPRTGEDRGRTSAA
ncbi:family 1 glycosylhydrolase [Actinocorallia herbida]|uniref:family 1 glycosylhydrolase n=1 Tax=Actinocorallia herbida TaxID=58109 RepID=UPI000F4CC319|nr:family 1 glycosylhydrolase [Actinocorallia herbida]